MNTTPDYILEALELASKAIRTAMNRAPKSIHNREKFDLCLADAAVNKALHKAKSRGEV